MTKPTVPTLKVTGGLDCNAAYMPQRGTVYLLGTRLGTWHNGLDTVLCTVVSMLVAHRLGFVECARPTAIDLFSNESTRLQK